MVSPNRNTGIITTFSPCGKIPSSYDSSNKLELKSGKLSDERYKMKSRGEISENSIKIKTCSDVSSKNLHVIHSVFSVVRPPAAGEFGFEGALWRILSMWRREAFILSGGPGENNAFSFIERSPLAPQASCLAQGCVYKKHTRKARVGFRSGSRWIAMKAIN